MQSVILYFDFGTQHRHLEFLTLCTHTIVKRVVDAPVKV